VTFPAHRFEADGRELYECPICGEWHESRLAGFYHLTDEEREGLRQYAESFKKIAENYKRTVSGLDSATQDLSDSALINGDMGD
jgi:hypothetical protein